MRKKYNSANLEICSELLTLKIGYDRTGCGFLTVLVHNRQVVDGIRVRDRVGCA